MSATHLNKVAIIIPAFKPDVCLVDLVRGLNTHGFQNIVAVNDGSGEKFDSIFMAVGDLECKVLLHHENAGKGEALKTAFREIMRNPGEIEWVITVDADGQHKLEDIEKIAIHALSNPSQQLILGVRNFSRENGVPFRSQFGNELTRRIFWLMTRQRLSDTQTGLRVISMEILPVFTELKAKRYEFEMEMLMTCSAKGIQISEVPIATVYLDGNKSSHFNPIVDSMKIYFVVFRYAIISVLSAVLDTILFVIANVLSSNLLVSMVIARAISANFNFLMARRFIFKSGGSLPWEYVKYGLLVLLNLAIASGAIEILVNTGVNVYAAKIGVEICLFVANFVMQKFFVFFIGPNLKFKKSWG